MASLNKMTKEARAKKSSAKPKQPPKKAPSPVNFKSTEYIQDSDAEDREQTTDESPPENLAHAASKINGKLPAPSGSSSSSEDESGNEEESSSEEESDASSEQVLAVLEPVKKTTKAPIAKTVTFDKPAPYEPPSGFELEDIEESSRVSQLLKKSNLAGKQIWYFTAPAHIPVASITQMSLQDAKDGNAIFSYKGSDYGFVRDTGADKTYTKIMVPSSSDAGYRISSKQADQVLHFQQIVELPGVTVPGTSSKATVPAAKSIRPQPRGLKMRFRPIGLGNGNMSDMHSSSDEDSSSDKELGDSPAFRRPTAIDSDNDGPKFSDEEMTEAPPPPLELVSKFKIEKSSTKEKKESSTASLKRKHSKGKEKKSKNSSYRPSDTDDRKLNRMKKKQTEPQRNLTDRASVSTKAHPSSHVSSHPPTSSAPAKSIPSPSSPALQTSHASAVSVNTELMQPSQKLKSRRIGAPHKRLVETERMQFR